MTHECSAPRLALNVPPHRQVVIIFIRHNKHLTCKEHRAGVGRSGARPQLCCLPRGAGQSLHPLSLLPSQVFVAEASWVESQSTSQAHGGALPAPCFPP